MRTLGNFLWFIFGGFFSGKSHNYLVFGQQNPKESDSVEVIRIVKYDKNWKRLSAVSIKGANTYIPFDAGSLRMTETGGKLYIHTCHEMYDDDNSGYHHQANMTFVIKQSTMKVVDQYYDVMNIAQAGYVSHSFNQFVKTDGSKVYRVDQGDAYPRGVYMTSCDVTGDVEDVDYVCAFEYNTLKDVSSNYTGVSVGGFELSEENCLLVGNEDTEDDADNRNAFVSIIKKDMSLQNTVWQSAEWQNRLWTLSKRQGMFLTGMRFLWRPACTISESAGEAEIMRNTAPGCFPGWGTGRLRRWFGTIRIFLAACRTVCAAVPSYTWQTSWCRGQRQSPSGSAFCRNLKSSGRTRRPWRRYRPDILQPCGQQIPYGRPAEPVLPKN